MKSPTVFLLLDSFGLFSCVFSSKWTCQFCKLAGSSGLTLSSHCVSNVSPGTFLGCSCFLC